MHVRVSGGTSIIAEKGYWRGQPFLDSCITLNTQQVYLLARAYPKHILMGAIVKMFDSLQIGGASGMEL